MSAWAAVQCCGWVALLAPCRAAAVCGGPAWQGGRAAPPAAASPLPPRRRTPLLVRRIGDLLEQVEQGGQVVATDHVDIAEDITAARRDSDITAWVNVIHGCNEKVRLRGSIPCSLRMSSAQQPLPGLLWERTAFCSGAPRPLKPARCYSPRIVLPPLPALLQCTYCIVPFTRGAEQSRTPDAIKREMLALGEAGYKEVRRALPRAQRAGRLRLSGCRRRPRARCRVAPARRGAASTSHPSHPHPPLIPLIASLIIR